MGFNQGRDNKMTSPKDNIFETDAAANSSNTDGQMDRQTDRRMDGQTNKLRDRPANKWTDNLGWVGYTLSALKQLYLDIELFLELAVKSF